MAVKQGAEGHVSPLKKELRGVRAFIHSLKHEVHEPLVKLRGDESKMSCVNVTVVPCRP